MGKFDKYDLPAGPTGRSVAAAPASARVAALVEQGRRAAGQPGAAAKVAGTSGIRAAIALDATGSMGPLIDSARAAIDEIVRRVTQEAKSAVEIELFVYRDYDVPHALLHRSGAQSEAEPLRQWLSKVRPEGGGANHGEAVETALQAIADDGQYTVILVAGDEPSNSAATVRRMAGRQAATALDLARTLGAQGTAVHTFVVGGDPRTAADFGRIAEASGGRTGRLDGSRDMIDLAVMSIIGSASGAAAVREYMARHQLSANAQAFGQLLLSSK